MRALSIVDVLNEDSDGAQSAQLKSEEKIRQNQKINAQFQNEAKSILKFKNLKSMTLKSLETRRKY